jgi:hypothetical protein
MVVVNHDPTRILAICIRFQLMGLAVVAPHDIVEVRRTRVPVSSDPEIRIKMIRVIGKLASDYQIATAVVEPGSTVATWLEGTDVNVRPVSMNIVMRNVGSASARKIKYADLFGHLVRQHPKLDRLVTRLPATGEIARTERWRVPIMLAVALGLAAQADETRADAQANQQPQHRNL